MTEAGVAATRVSNKRLLMRDEGIRGAISVLNGESLPGRCVYLVGRSNSRRHQFLRNLMFSWADFLYIEQLILQALVEGDFNVREI